MPAAADAVARLRDRTIVVLEFWSQCSLAYSALACCRTGMSGSFFPEGEEVSTRAKFGVEISSLLERDAIKVPVGSSFAESVAGAIGARNNVSLQHLRSDCAQILLGLKS